MAFLSLASAQLVHTLGLGGGGERIFSGNGETRNPYIPWAIGVGFLTALAAAALPGIDSLLGASRIGLIDAIVCLLSAGTSFASNEILKGDHSQTSPVKR
jgi:Ca2+-transporting ATPase